MDDNRTNKLNSVLFDVGMNKPLREGQKEVLKWHEAIPMNKKYVIINAPTGSGKSYLILNIIKELKNLRSNLKIDIITATKILQEQYVNDYNFIQNLWGKNNYECHQHKTSCDKGSIMNKQKKTTCENCPYQIEKSRWLDSDISLTSFHAMSLYALYVNDFITQVRKPDILVVDEAHLLESTFTGFLSFTINLKLYKSFIRKENFVDIENSFAVVNDINETKKFCKEILLSELEYVYGRDLSKLTGTKANIEKELEDANRLKDIIEKIKKFIADDNINNWIFDKKIIKGNINVDIKPLWCSDKLRDNMFNSYERVYFMSATIFNIDTFCKMYGLDKKDCATISLDSTFPAENRPIYYIDCGKMSYNQKTESWKTFIPMINKILNKYKGMKGIIHCNSFELMEWIERDIRSDRFIFSKAGSAREVLNEHANRTDDCVIVSPAFKEGVDLSDDLARFSIVLKIPYPDLSAKINKIRLSEEPEWYSTTTVQTLIQILGRAVRSETDHCDSFILDGSFSDLLRYSGHIFPKWIVSAIKKIKRG